MMIIIKMSVLIAFEAEAASIKLKFSLYLPESHPQTKVATEWAEEVEKKTNGKVVISIFPKGTLVKAPNIYDSVVKGISDIGFGIFAYTRERFPVMAAVDLPMGYPNGKTASRVANNFAKFFQPKELKNVKVLYLHAPGPVLLHTKKPVRTLEDIKGEKIRAYGQGAEVARALGAVAVMPKMEAYVALQKGVIQGIYGPAEILKTWRIGEITPNTTDTSIVGYTITNFVITNQEIWNALPSDVQNVIENLSGRWVDLHGAAWDNMAQEALKLEGREIIQLAEEEIWKWREAVEPIIGEYIKYTPNGYKYVNKLEDLMGMAYKGVKCPAGFYPCDERCCKKTAE